MKPAKILIVEDDAVMAENLRRTLTKMNYEVTGLATSALEAVALHLSTRPDLILMDVQLRGKNDGVEAAAKIHRHSDTPVIYLTASTSKAVVGEAKKTEPYAYLSKPVRNMELRASIEVALYRGRQDQRLKHLNQVLRSLRDINQLINKEKDAQRLLDNACRIIIHSRGYRLAWIIQEAGPDPWKKPLAQAGQDRAFLKDLASAVAGKPKSRWPFRKAFEKRQAEVCQDILSDPAFKDVHPAASRLGLVAAAGLPMIHGDRFFGVLCVLSDQSDIFDKEEVQLLSELAGDLAFALFSLETEGQIAYQAQLIDEVNDAIIAADAQYRMTAWNAKAESMYGWKAEEVLGRFGLDITRTEYPSMDRAEMLRLIAERGSWRGEATQVRKDGTRFPVEISSVVLRDATGKVAGYVSINRDISERKRADEALAAERSIMSTLIDSLPDNVFIKDAQGRILLDNIAHRRLLGHLELKDVVGKSDRDFFAPELAERYLADERRIVESSRPLINYEEPTVDPEGNTHWLLTTKAPVLDARGTVTALVGINRDITDRKRAQEALRQSVSLLQATLESTADGLLVVDNKGKISGFNEQFVQLWRIPSAVLDSRDGRKALDFILDQLKNPDKLINKVEALHSQPEATSFDVMEFKDGRLIERYSQPQRLDGIPVGRVWSFRDVTERSRAEEELRRLGQRHEATLASHPDIIMEVDLNKIYVWANSAGMEFFGPNVIGKEAAFFFEGEQDTYAKVEPLFKGDPKLFYVESWQRRRDGQKRLLAWWSKGLKDAEGRTLGVLSSARDITDQNAAEAALRESEQKYRELVENINDVIYTTTAEGQILYVSPAVERILGHTPEELVGLNFMSFVWPEDTPIVQKALTDIMSDRLHPSEYRLRKKDGSHAWVRTSSRVTFTEGGTEKRITGALVDVTDRKKAEQELEQHRLHLEELVEERTLELRQAHQQIEHILQSAGEGIFGLDLQGQLTFINEAGAHMLGWTAEELKWQKVHPLIHAAEPDGKPCTWEESPEYRALERGVSCPETGAIYKKKDGTLFSVEFIGTPIVDKGSPVGAVVVFRDVTARNQAEEERLKRIEELEKFNRAMIDREKRIIEIKEEVNRLCRELGREPKYPVVWE